MGHSFVSFRGRDVDLRDAHVQWMMLAVTSERNRLDQFVPVPETVDRMLEWWQSVHSAIGPGCVRADLDRFLVDQESMEAFRLLLNKVDERLDEFGDIVPGSYVEPFRPFHMLEFADWPSMKARNIVHQVRGLVDTRST